MTFHTSRWINRVSYVTHIQDNMVINQGNVIGINLINFSFNVAGINTHDPYNIHRWFTDVSLSLQIIDTIVMLDRYILSHKGLQWIVFDAVSIRFGLIYYFIDEYVYIYTYIYRYILVNISQLWTYGQPTFSAYFMHHNIVLQEAHVIGHRARPAVHQNIFVYTINRILIVNIQLISAVRGFSWRF